MAVTRGTTGSGQSTTGATEELFYDASQGDTPCTTLAVRNVHATVACFIRIDGLHAGVAIGAGVRIPAGEKEYFRFGEKNGARKAWVAGDGAATTIDWGPVASMSDPS